MIAAHVLSLCRSLGPGLVNHLWQSSLFAAGVWLATLLLRKNQARVRYMLWLSASIKFLIPFSLLIGLGGFLPKPSHTPKEPYAALYSTADVIAQPFADNTQMPVPFSAHTSIHRERFTAYLPVVLALVWFGGAVTCLLVWYARWKQVCVMLKRAVPAEQGREVATLRRMKTSIVGNIRIPLLLSRDLIEPGIFGIFRPVLIWPEQFSEILDDQHVDAIVAHELIHVRHHDNLSATVLMAVQAAFWFHPMCGGLGRASWRSASVHVMRR